MTYARKVELFRQHGGCGITPFLAVNYRHWRDYSEDDVKRMVHFCQKDAIMVGLLAIFAESDQLFQKTYRNSTQAPQLTLAPPYVTGVITEVPFEHSTLNQTECGWTGTPAMLDLAAQYGGEWAWDPATLEGPGMLEMSNTYRVYT